MLIAIVNKSTLVTDADAEVMTAAVSWQVHHHYAPAWGVIPPSVAYLSTEPAVTVPGTAVIAILDDADQAGDLGWHTEAQGGVVYGRVFASPVLQNGGNALTDALSVASVLSHEVLETAGDVACDLWADAGNGTAYARELCDAVESDSYGVTLPGNGTTVMVSNFLLPGWFDPQGAAHTKCDQMGLTTGPFSVRPTGYTVTMASGQVSQSYGEHYPEWRKDTKKSPIARTARRLLQGA